VTYTLTDDDQLILDFTAQSDAATPFNITHHGYWNLNAGKEGDGVYHELRIDSDFFLEVDMEMIPTGKIVPVQGTSFDLRRAMPLASRLRPLHPELAATGGIDHNFVFENSGLQAMAVLHSPVTGRTLTVESDQPGLQVYTGQWLDPATSGHAPFAGIALETQHFPDSPNQPHFPDTILRPGRPFASRTIYGFSVG
jgi:aldose 1-epimerase